MVPPEGNDWMEYRQYVVRSLEDLKRGQLEQGDQIVLIRVDLAMLKVRASIWGGVAGLVPAMIGVIAVVVGGH